MRTDRTFTHATGERIHRDSRSCRRRLLCCLGGTDYRGRRSRLSKYTRRCAGMRSYRSDLLVCIDCVRHSHDCRLLRRNWSGVLNLRCRNCLGSGRTPTFVKATMRRRAPFRSLLREVPVGCLLKVRPVLQPGQIEGYFALRLPLLPVPAAFSALRVPCRSPSISLLRGASRKITFEWSGAFSVCETLFARTSIQIVPHHQLDSSRIRVLLVGKHQGSDLPGTERHAGHG
jgi:hypothetical protein